MVLINLEKCIGCRICIPYCTSKALRIDRGSRKVLIDEELCVECNTCVRAVPCPVDAIEPTPLSISREIRSFFSDPITVHTMTGIPGRGTEEMKTNDVTGRFRRGEVGFAIDIGRPHVGLKLSELGRFLKVLHETGVVFERENPILYLLEDVEEGRIRRNLEDERILSAVIEFKTSLTRVGEVVKRLRYLAETTDTVFSVGVVSRVEPDGIIPVIDALNRIGFKVAATAKVNVGLGRPLCLD